MKSLNVGIEVRVTGNKSCHQFEIGEELIISRVYNKGEITEHYRCKQQVQPYHDYILVREDFELINKPKENFMPVKKRRGRRQ